MGCTQLFWIEINQKQEVEVLMTLLAKAILVILMSLSLLENTSTHFAWYTYHFFDYDVTNKTLVTLDVWSQTLHNITIKAEPTQFDSISDKLEVTHALGPPEIPAGKSFLPLDLYVYGCELKTISKGRDPSFHFP